MSAVGSGVVSVLRVVLPHSPPLANALLPCFVAVLVTTGELVGGGVSSRVPSVLPIALRREKQLKNQLMSLRRERKRSRKRRRAELSGSDSDSAGGSVGVGGAGGGGRGGGGASDSESNGDGDGNSDSDSDGDGDDGDRIVPRGRLFAMEADDNGYITVVARRPLKPLQHLDQLATPAITTDGHKPETRLIKNALQELRNEDRKLFRTLHVPKEVGRAGRPRSLLAPGPLGVLAALSPLSDRANVELVYDAGSSMLHCRALRNVAAGSAIALVLRARS